MNYKALAQDFEKRGFLIIDEFFIQPKIDEIELELRRYVDHIDPSQAKGRVVYDAEGKIRNLFQMEQQDPYFAELANTPAMVQLATAVFDDEPLSMGVELFGKPARVGSEVPYHQDNAYFNLFPDHALTCWIALADATQKNGCVRYIEGSHKLGNLPHRASGVQGNSMRLAEMPADVGPEVCGIVRRGGALIHHCNTIHRSDPNLSSQDRPGLLFVYKAARCRVDRAGAAKYHAVLAAAK